MIKKITGEKKLWMRTIGSTIVGEFLDTLFFATIAFIGILSLNELATMIICQFVWKVSYEIISTPVTYYVIKKFKRIEYGE